MMNQKWMMRDALRNTKAMPEESTQSSQGMVSAGPLLIFLGPQSPGLPEFWPELRELLLRIFSDSLQLYDSCSHRISKVLL